ncbi:MAG: protein kinase [Polyangiaceae bacterium]
MTDSPAQQASPVATGEVIAGKYRVERVLGIGGMGVVVAATHLQLEQRVALKFLRAEARDNDEVVERFTREARAAAKISSEHVGRVIDVGQLESGELFMVMEHLEGHDLSSVLTTEGRLPFARAVDYVLQACEAVAEAHVHGIVHRDLKPANLFLARRVDGTEVIKVLDFGISKITQHRSGDASITDPKLTNPTAVMGSPLYMSPEQMHSSMRVDARSDIWALGIILYELVSGKTPFEAETIPLIHAAILHNAPPPLRERAVNAPARFEQIVQRCLEKDPAGRYQEIVDLVAALAPLSSRQGRISLGKVGRLRNMRTASDRPAGNALAPSVPSGPSSTVTSWGSAPKRTGMRTTGVVLAVAAFTGGAALVLGGIIPVPRFVAGLGAGEAASAAPETGHTAAAGAAPEPAGGSPNRAAAAGAQGAEAQAAAEAARKAEEQAEAGRKAEQETKAAAAKAEAGRLFKEANAKLAARDYLAAAAIYAQADGVWPGAKPKYKAALSYDKVGRRDEAIAWYRKFLESSPDAAAFTQGEIVESTKRLALLERVAAMRARPGPALPPASATPSAEPVAEPTPPAAKPDAPPADGGDGTKGFGDRK